MPLLCRLPQGLRQELEQLQLQLQAQQVLELVQRVPRRAPRAQRQVRQRRGQTQVPEPESTGLRTAANPRPPDLRLVRLREPGQALRLEPSMLRGWPTWPWGQWCWKST